MLSRDQDLLGYQNQGLISCDQVWNWKSSASTMGCHYCRIHYQCLNTSKAWTAWLFLRLWTSFGIC